MKNYLIYLIVNLIVIHIFYYIEKKEIFVIDCYKEFIKDYFNRMLILNFIMSVLSIFIGWVFIVIYYILKLKKKFKK